MPAALNSIEFIGNVHAGFPSPETGHKETPFDLNQYLQTSADSVCLARVKGDSMINAQIPADSIIIIDKSAQPRNNSIVVASLAGEKVIKHIVKTHAGLFLASNHPQHKPILVLPEMDFAICGVVTHVIVKLIK
ncbi:MAG: S24 family peptidase [Chitinophagaceae bacterium]